MDSIKLCDQEGKEISNHVKAYIDDGKLILYGQDLGSGVEEFWGDSDYEYYYTLSVKNTEKIHKLLKNDSGEDLELLELVKIYFSGIDGCKDFREYCEKHRIKYDFYSIYLRLILKICDKTMTGKFPILLSILTLMSFFSSSARAEDFSAEKQPPSIQSILKAESRVKESKEIIDIINKIDTTYDNLFDKLNNKKPLVVFFDTAHGKLSNGEWQGGKITHRLSCTGNPEESPDPHS